MGKSPENEEIPENEVNSATRWVNLANSLGAWNWERKDCAEEFSSIIDTGFSGGGLRSYSRFRMYVEYSMRYYQKQIRRSKKKKRIEICVCESSRTGVGG